jgi:predicted ester cyclase
LVALCMVPIRRGETRVDEEEEASVSDTEENKALVRRFFEAQNRGDLAAVEGMMTLEFVNHHRGFAQQLSREGYTRDLIDDRAACSNIRFIIEDQAADGDGVISRFTIRGIHDRGEWRGFAPTGMEFEASYISIHRVAGGEIAEEWREGGGLLGLTQERLEQEVRERERVEQELQVARHIQQTSLPKRCPNRRAGRSLHSTDPPGR